MADVSCANGVAVVQRGRTDEQVREGDHFPDSSRVVIHFRRDLRHLSAETLDGNRGENLVEIVPSLLCLVRSLRAMKTVLQLDYGDRREQDLVLAVLLLECASSLLIGLASRSATIRTLESRTNPIRAGLRARGEHQWRLAHPQQSPRPGPARSRGSFRTPLRSRCIR